MLAFISPFYFMLFSKHIFAVLKSMLKLKSISEAVREGWAAGKPPLLGRRSNRLNIFRSRRGQSTILWAELKHLFRTLCLAPIYILRDGLLGADNNSVSDCFEETCMKFLFHLKQLCWRDGDIKYMMKEKSLRKSDYGLQACSVNFTMLAGFPALKHSSAFQIRLNCLRKYLIFSGKKHALFEVLWLGNKKQHEYTTFAAYGW